MRKVKEYITLKREMHWLTHWNQHTNPSIIDFKMSNIYSIIEDLCIHNTH